MGSLVFLSWGIAGNYFFLNLTMIQKDINNKCCIYSYMVWKISRLVWKKKTDVSQCIRIGNICFHFSFFIKLYVAINYKNLVWRIFGNRKSLNRM